jgi:hypothetical protein
MSGIITMVLLPATSQLALAAMMIALAAVVKNLKNVSLIWYPARNPASTLTNKSAG